MLLHVCFEEWTVTLVVVRNGIEPIGVYVNDFLSFSIDTLYMSQVGLIVLECENNFLDNEDLPQSD